MSSHSQKFTRVTFAASGMTLEQWNSPQEQDRRRARWQAMRHKRRFQQSKAAAAGMTLEQWKEHKAALAHCPSTSHAEYLKAYRVTPRGKEIAKRSGRKCRDKKLQRVRALKNKPCLDCGGMFHPEAMEFDHRDGEIKSFSVATFARNVGDDLFYKEVAKCDLVCANCHRVRTARRRAGLSATLPVPEYEI